MQTHPLATPAQVWAAINAAANVASTPGWGGVINRMANDPNEIHGVRHREHPVHGVQFHPESVMTQHGKALLKNFLELAR